MQFCFSTNLFENYTSLFCVLGKFLEKDLKSGGFWICLCFLLDVFLVRLELLNYKGSCLGQLTKLDQNENAAAPDRFIKVFQHNFGHSLREL